MYAKHSQRCEKPRRRRFKMYRKEPRACLYCTTIVTGVCGSEEILRNCQRGIMLKFRGKLGESHKKAAPSHGRLPARPETKLRGSVRRVLTWHRRHGETTMSGNGKTTRLVCIPVSLGFQLTKQGYIDLTPRNHLRVGHRPTYLIVLQDLASSVDQRSDRVW